MRLLMYSHPNFIFSIVFNAIKPIIALNTVVFVQKKGSNRSWVFIDSKVLNKCPLNVLLGNLVIGTSFIPFHIIGWKEVFLCQRLTSYSFKYNVQMFMILLILMPIYKSKSGSVLLPSY